MPGDLFRALQAKILGAGTPSSRNCKKQMQRRKLSKQTTNKAKPRLQISVRLLVTFC
jgi:hypothetical protein